MGWHPAATWKERIISLKGLWGVTFVFVIAMGGIMAGYFTPVEAGAAGATAMYLVGVINRKLTWKGSFRALLEAGKDRRLDHAPHFRRHAIQQLPDGERGDLGVFPIISSPQT